MISIFYCDAFLQHKTDLGHPECPERLSAVVQRLQQGRWADQLGWRTPREIQIYNPQPWIEQVHSRRYIEQVRHLSEQSGGSLDADTPLSRQSYDVACLAVNAWIDGVEAVLSTQHPAFVLARPPGHHALPNQGMGFCIFANAAIAAFYALAQTNVERVAILDWDVHHGNGTQAIVENSAQIAYCSLHQSPCYPGTGSADETGAHHNVLNIPMPPGSDFARYEHQFQAQVIPFLQAFNPDLLIVSAGYDANQADPLANMSLRPSDYGQFTAHCLAITPKVLLGLEGGYDLESLSLSVEATVAACLT